MTAIVNTRLDIGGYGYEIPPNGPLNGRPTVFFGFQTDEDEQNRQEHWVNGSGFHVNTDRDVSAVMKMWEKYGWRKKLNGNRANLVITGGEPLSEDNIDGTEALMTVNSRSNIYIETSGGHSPTEDIERDAEGFIVRQNPSDFVSDGENEEVHGPLMDLSAVIRQGKGHFVFEIGEKDDFDAMKEVMRLYRVPKDRTWLSPTPEDGDNYEKIADFCREKAKDQTFGYANWPSPAVEDDSDDEEA